MTTELLHQDWLVDGAGQCQSRPTRRPWDLLQDHYYLHQFLSDILQILAHAPHELDQWDYLPPIRCQVRQLILNSYWLRTQRADPDPKTGTTVITLYDEIGYPLTVQNVITAPRVTTPIHNHGTWGVVALLEGQERHSFWSYPAKGDRITLASQQVFSAGEIISFSPKAIHQVETLGPGPALTFQLYGDTQPNARFQFDPETLTAKPF
ncbi:cupin [Nodosilinea sp. P-1105]|uniref:cysteine dioxygenase family protein n=1 Tax=Nodosilinea sp. P-1105 TaxID=2546229 RepID=UPI00146B6B2B|nr:cupin [Nodosilinea sp. P-1105]NMF84503.1 cupin [Nodosilinea sp. P-1105]